MTPIVVLWNPEAGKSARTEQARTELEARDDVEVVEPGSAADAERLAREAAVSGATLVVAAGGDGTVSAVARGLVAASGDSALSVLPTGTANDFARTLGLPPDPLDAIALWDRPDLRTIDVVRFSTPWVERRFVNVATGGNSARVHECLTEELKRQWGPLCYLRGALDVVSDLVTFATTVQVDDAPPERFDTLTVIVGNARHAAGGLAVAPLADPGDGLADLVLVRDGQPLEIASTTVQFLLGNYLESDMIEHRRGRRIRVDAEPPMSFSVDGDRERAGGAEFVVEPGALRVVVGKRYEAVPGR